MARITRVEIHKVDLVPKVKRTDAIQAFVTQETPIVRIFTDDGASGTGYTYTIGQGGSSIVALLRDHMGPWLIGRDADMVEELWKGLFFFTHATSVGGITAFALAAIDTALWDLRCRKAGLPLHVMAGGAQRRIPIYSTEGGWLHVDASALVDDALAVKAKGFGGTKIKVGRPHVSEDVARLGAVRDAVGAGFEIMTDANQAFTVSEAIRRARAFEPLDLAWFEEPLPAEDIDGHVRLSNSTSLPIAVGESLYHPSHFREYLQRGACSIVQVDVGTRRRHHAVAQDRASRRDVQRDGLPAFPDGASCRPVRRRAQRGLGRIHPAARRYHRQPHPHRGRPCHAIGQARPRHRMGLAGDRENGRRAGGHWKIVGAGPTRPSPLGSQAYRPSVRLHAQRLQPVVLLLGPASARRGVVVQRLGSGDERRLIGHHDRLALALEPVGQRQLGLADLRRSPSRRPA